MRPGNFTQGPTLGYNLPWLHRRTMRPRYILPSKIRFPHARILWPRSGGSYYLRGRPVGKRDNDKAGTMTVAPTLPRLLRAAATPLSKTPTGVGESSPIQLPASTWLVRLHHDPDVVAVHGIHGGWIERSDLLRLATATYQEPSVPNSRRLLVGMLMWGFGDIAYGPHRTATILSYPQLNERLRDATRLCLAGDLRSAYVACDIPRLGATFVTKYLYFLGTAAGLRPQPVVLDRRVAEWLHQAEGAAFAKQFARYTTPKPGCRIESLQKWPDGYVRFVEAVNIWAQELQCSPDAIEMFMWQIGIDANDIRS